MDIRRLKTEEMDGP